MVRKIFLRSRKTTTYATYDLKNTITVEAEIHQYPVEATLDDDDDDGNNRDAIDIALGIVNDASTVKNDIRRIEKAKFNKKHG